MGENPTPLEPDRTARHPIGVVASRTGLPPDVLRAWERRYRAVVPGRTSTRRRLYSDHDIARFRLLRNAVDGGRRISDVASLGFAELEALAREDGRQLVGAHPSGRGASQEAGGYVVTALAAAEAMDGDALHRTLEAAEAGLGSSAARRDVVVPLLRCIGERWRDGSLRIASEHLATGIVRTLLGAMGRTAWVTPSAPVVVMATLPGCRHELGALLAAAAAVEIGWDPVFAGAELPADEIAAVVKRRSACAIGLSVVFPPADPSIRAELKRLRRLVGSKIAILVGGSGAASYDSEILEIEARRTEDLGVFQDALEALR